MRRTDIMIVKAVLWHEIGGGPLKNSSSECAAQPTMHNLRPLLPRPRHTCRAKPLQQLTDLHALAALQATESISLEHHCSDCSCQSFAAR